jgi:APA family basic amino acid/polyamine antiporter
MHGFRVRAGTRFQDLLVVLKLAMLLAFLAFAGMSLGRPWEGMATAGQRPEGWMVIPALAVSLTWISLSYCGFNAAIYITEETQHGGKTVRDALIIGTLIVTTLYLLLNAVFVLAPPASEVVGKEDVAAVAARYVGGAKLETLLRYVILLSLATSVLSMMMTGPRVYAKMAEDGVLPGWFKFDAELPGRGVFAQGVLAVAVVSIATLRQLLSYLGLTLSLCAALTVAAIFVLKRRGEPVEVIGYPWTPLAFVIGTLAIVLTAGTQRPIELAVAAATLAVGWFAYQFSHPHRPHLGNESPRPRDQDA